MRLNDLKSAASVALLLMSATAPQGFAQQTQVSPTAPAVQGEDAGLPPEPKATEPLYLRDTGKDYTHLKGYKFLNLIAPYTSTQVPLPSIQNTPRLATLLRDGKIYLGLSDAVTLALENNYDIAIARINLDIADTDILRARAGSTLRGVSTGLVTNTLGGTTSTITSGGGPGGTSSASGGSGTGTSGLVLSTNGGGPLPYNYDPQLTSTVEFERATTQSSSAIAPTATANTLTANVAYQQGFSTGTLLNVGFNNTRTATTSVLTNYTPSINTTLRATATQHLLQGFGFNLNRRFIVEAVNDRRITDSAFRQQIIYTVTQVESIYWSLVSAYEDEQAKERALQQSTQLASDNRKQLEIGTLAPLDVVNSDSAVATDRQALITSKSNLEYQQLLMKQAIARDLSQSLIANAPVVPTDRIGLERTPEEDMKVDDLVRLAYVNNPQIEQARLTMKNNEITIRGEKNGLLPTVDAFGFYGTNALGGTPNKNAVNLGTGSTTGPSTVPGGYGGTLQNLLSANNPDYGVGVNITIPIRNRTAQADQARSQMEYRQTQMRLQQLYTQIRIQVVNGQYALTNDRANVEAAQAARDYGAQSLDAEQKKYKLGASTTANVLQQERNLATAENNLISATAAYAKDRSALSQIVSNTLDRYGILLADAASGTVTQTPVVPGLTAPKAPAPPKPLTSTP